MPDDNPFADIEGSLKKAGAALREEGIPFLLGGSLASWARGGPETRHDLDLMIRESDVEAALDALERVGMKREIPPEEWLVKVWDGDVLVDLIFHPKGMPITDEVIERGETMAVLSMEMRVMSLEDVMATKLMALTENTLTYDTLLAMARALREKIDWPRLRHATQGSPFADAFFVLLDRLGIVPQEAQHAEPGAGTGRSEVRVLGRPGAGSRAGTAG